MGHFAGWTAVFEQGGPGTRLATILVEPQTKETDMSARAKAIVIVTVVVVVIWVGAKLGSAVEDLGSQIESQRAAVMEQN